MYILLKKIFKKGVEQRITPLATTPRQLAALRSDQTTDRRASSGTWVGIAFIEELKHNLLTVREGLHPFFMHYLTLEPFFKEGEQPFIM